MTLCVSCGKRIWSDAVSIPGHGDYHYECAELTGVVSLVDMDDETINKAIADIEERYSDLKKRGRGASDEEWLELRQRQMILTERLRIVELIRRKRQKAPKTKGAEPRKWP